VRHLSTRTFVLAGLAVALILVFFVSPHASSSPDGLEKVAADTGIDRSVTDHTMADSPLADYSVDGVEDSSLGTGMAGIVGVAITFALGAGIVTVLKRSRLGKAPPPTTAT
jgi:cobalt/nickel transport system permease protein